ncbi:hypothetical protein AcW1_008179 [Taiwanofungus camphoratus]|nr:hypothetical protein AcW1_008179 [Antrodia cinnamomea]
MHFEVPTCNQVGGGARRNQAPRRDPRLAARIRAVRPAHRVARRARGASPSQSCLSRLTPSAARCPHIPQALTGKMVLFGYDADGRPAMYLRPSRQNTEETVRQMHFLTWLLERAVDLMGPGVETIALMVDFADKAKNPSFAQSRASLNILQNHYPERLGRALIANVPFLLNAFFKVITPFVDPATRPKMRFNPSCVRDGLFAPHMLVREWGGARAFEYEHDRYWPVLLRMCQDRRAKMLAAWRESGAKVGLKEWDLKCAAENEKIGMVNAGLAKGLSEATGEEHHSD